VNIIAIIEKLKKHFNIQKEVDLAKSLGIKQSTLATWKMRGTVNLKTILSKCIDIDLNWLLKDSDITNTKYFSLQDKQASYISEQEIIETIAKNERIPVLLIPEKASAGYSKGFGNDLHRKYRIMQFMDYKNGYQYRCFEIQGDSMENTNSPTSIQSGDYVLGERIEDRQALKDGIVYILCTHEGIVCKRLEIKEEKLILHSENKRYLPKTIDNQQVREFWKVIWVHRELK
jgi:phage repressor protein C with HTH and peptisase S24 domain